MRAKRSKRYRKLMAFYTRTFSFRPPYQVLATASFLRACHAFHMPPQKSLENTLHGPTKVFITRCSLAKAMREQRQQVPHSDNGRKQKRPEWLPPPTEVPLRYCTHRHHHVAHDDTSTMGNEQDAKEEAILSEQECLADLLSGQPKGNELPKNKQHYILATAGEGPSSAAEEARSFNHGKKRKRGEQNEGGGQSVDVRDAVRRIPGVPIVYVKRSVMVLEDLSTASLRLAKSQEKSKLKDGILGGGPRNAAGGGSDDEAEEHNDRRDHPCSLLPLDDTPEQQHVRRGMKKAKGPNPLSVRKKKAKARMPHGIAARVELDSVGGAGVGEEELSETGVNGSHSEGQVVPKAKRRRKHGKNKKAGEGGANDDDPREADVDGTLVNEVPD